MINHCAWDILCAWAKNSATATNCPQLDYGEIESVSNWIAEHSPRPKLFFRLKCSKCFSSRCIFFLLIGASVRQSLSSRDFWSGLQEPLWLLQWSFVRPCQWTVPLFTRVSRRKGIYMPNFHKEWLFWSSAGKKMKLL